MISAKRELKGLDKPHYWKEHGMYKVRAGMWIFVGTTLMTCHANMLYWTKLNVTGVQ